MLVSIVHPFMMYSESGDANEYTMTLGHPLDFLVTSCPLTVQTCGKAIALEFIFQICHFYRSVQFSQMDGER
jgi:hypothetical protein